MAEENNTQTAVQAGLDLAVAKDKIVQIEEIPVAILPEGTRYELLTKAMDEAEKRAPAPRRLRGAASHQELGSFIRHVNLFKDDGSTLWADLDAVKLTAILNYHNPRNPEGPRVQVIPEPPEDENAPPRKYMVEDVERAQAAADGARWGDHRATYVCPLSRQWKLWVAKNEKPMTQEEFGTFIEDNMADIAARAEYPAPTEVLKLARNLVVHQTGQFKSTMDITTGERTLINIVEHAQESMKIPAKFLLQLPVFENGQKYAVDARLRFQLRNGTTPQFTYSLDRIEDIKRDAFSDVRLQAETETGLPLMVGSPENTLLAP